MTTPKELQAQLAAPAEPFGPVATQTTAAIAQTDRSLAPNPLSGGMTPRKLARILDASANLSNTKDFFILAEEIEEKDTQYRSLISTRKLAINGLPRVIDSASDSAKDKEVAEFVRQVMNGPAAANLILDLADGISKGLAVSEIIWDTSGTKWTPKQIDFVQPHFFDFDKKDGKTVVMRSGKRGEAPVALPYAKFIVHTPQLKSGLPIRAGLIRVAAWAWVAKAIVMKDWVAFAELFGQPVRVGKYQPGTSAADIAVLKRAVQSLGVDAAAVFPSTMEIEFVEASKNGGADIYEKLSRYLDEQLAKLIKGATLTSGDGGGKGSFALGKVHGEIGADILRSDATQLSNTIQRDLITPLVQMNFGIETPVPTFRLQVEEPEDLVGLANIIEKLVPLGLKVESSIITDKLGLPTPQAGADILGAPTATPQPTPIAQAVANSLQTNSQECLECNATGTPAKDDFDPVVEALADAWASVSKNAYDRLADAAKGAQSTQEMKDALFAQINSFDDEALRIILTRARTIGKTTGLAGGEV